MRKMGRGLVVVVVGLVLCWAGQAGAERGGLPLCQANLNVCNAALSAAQQFPATGQINSVISGDDGAIQAGATLSYTDNRDGTITDNNTKLMWEKKSDDGSIHDKDTVYTWVEAFTIHIAGLNAGGGFAGHTDWRLPNVKELQSIVDYGTSDPAVSPEFNNGCVANCSVTTCNCTGHRVSENGEPSGVSAYWSSTTVAGFPSDVWVVDTLFGTVGFGTSDRLLGVLAVRCGL
jgi:Protein of unknown function (DUF1566)